MKQWQSGGSDAVVVGVVTVAEVGSVPGLAAVEFSASVKVADAGAAGWPPVVAAVVVVGRISRSSTFRSAS
jgi:hypothetical protein